ncbi:hypothetical protein K439DRAFT_367501 [Ramaria rubella]|nr:hypothetical protein K439DRAFT_367501 [Ramaria rubella]
MNYSLALSLKVEKFVLQLVQERERCAALGPSQGNSGNSGSAANVSAGSASASARSAGASTSNSSANVNLGGVPEEKMEIEERALQMALEETYEETGRTWMPWAANGRAIRVGAIILIADSDTMVPEDCFRDAARELNESPEVAVIQHE